MKKIIFLFLLMKGVFAFGQSDALKPLTWYFDTSGTITKITPDSIYITGLDGTTVIPNGLTLANVVRATKTINDTATIIIFIAVNDSIYEKINGFEIRTFTWPLSGFLSSYNDFTFTYQILNKNWEQLNEKEILKIEFIKEFPSLITTQKAPN